MKGLSGFCRGIVLAAALSGGAALAQELAPADGANIVSPVLVIDADLLFNQTAYGKRVQSEIEDQATALRVENERLAAELTAEEKSLATRRPTMDAEAFRAEAEAFHAKVQDIRAAREQKETDLQTALDEARAAFDERTRPVLAELMRQRSAVVMMGRRDVLLYFSAVDVTDEAVAAIDTALGDGSTGDAGTDADTPAGQ